MSERNNDSHEQVNEQDTQDSQDTTSDQQTGLTLEAFYADAKERIRYVIHEGEPWYSVVDVIGLLTDSASPAVYWRVLKHRLQQEGASETVTNCNALKMLAPTANSA